LDPDRLMTLDVCSPSLSATVEHGVPAAGPPGAGLAGHLTTFVGVLL
jgi:hypothetical protein